MGTIKPSSLAIIISILLSNYFPIYSQTQIAFGVVSNGGIQQSNSSYIVIGSVGQPSVSKIQNSSNQLHFGFWSVYHQNVISKVEEDDVLPIRYKLEQNYPNPFNPSTIIKFGIPERTQVLINIYDVLGNEVTTLVNNEMESGWHEVQFDAEGYSSGLYLIRLQAGNYINTKKMLLVK